MASEETIEAMKIAIQNEGKSIKLYQDAALNTINPIVKKSLQFLAEWETEHLDKIKRAKAHIMGELEIFDIDVECKDDPMCVVKEFFSKNIDDFKLLLKGESSDLKVYEIAMDIEKRGGEFYKKAANQTEDPGAKELFEYLAREEEAHYKALEAMHTYLMDPESWPMDEQEWFQVT